MLLKCIMILLFCLIFVKQIVLIKKLLVPTKKSTFEKIVVTAGVLVLLCITYLFAGTFLDYLYAILAITTMLAMFYKQGITGDGLTILSRGLETYSWEKARICKNRRKRRAHDHLLLYNRKSYYKTAVCNRQKRAIVLNPGPEY